MKPGTRSIKSFVVIFIGLFKLFVAMDGLEHSSCICLATALKQLLAPTK